MKKRIGLLVAVEISPVLARFGAVLSKSEEAGFRVYSGEIGGAEIIAVHSGAGEISAAAAVQLLISHYQVDAVINFGLVGGLTPEMTASRLVLVEKVVHYDFDTSGLDGCEVGRYMDFPSVYLPVDEGLLQKAHELRPELKLVICASGDKFIAEAEKKARLHQMYGAEICEMEAAAVVLTCHRSKVPCLLVKVISDGLSGGAEEFEAMFHAASTACLELVEELIKKGLISCTAQKRS